MTKSFVLAACKVFLLLALLSVAAPAQDRFTVYRSESLTADSMAVSILKAPGAKGARLLYGYIYSSADLVVTVRRQGTQATGATTVTPTAHSGSTYDGGLTAFADSNSNDGVIVDTLHIPAGASWPMSFDRERWAGTAGARQLTFITDTVTATVQFVLVFENE